jgi:phenylacetic acid degradation operon negative regulatory protein
MTRLDYAEILEMFLWGVDKMMRPTLHNLLAGFEEFEHRKPNAKLFERLEKGGLIEKTGRGRHAVFQITDAGRRLVRYEGPSVHWAVPWDGSWRVVTFDVPEVRRRDRQILWRALRDRKLGLLQRSVWIWPHPLEEMLSKVIQAEGIPECFCGFTSRNLFFCTDTEVVASAWNWEEIDRRQQGYLDHPSLATKPLSSARELSQLAALARSERQAYQWAFSLDPWLPQSLWPKHYEGLRVEQEHRRFRQRLAQRLAALNT